MDGWKSIRGCTDAGPLDIDDYLEDWNELTVFEAAECFESWDCLRA